jgi:hypothetical protein
MSQVSFQLLPVLKEGEGLEENDDVTISIIDKQNSWTVVHRWKKNMKNQKDSLSEKWTKQQRQNFERFGDILYEELYKDFHVSEHATPVPNLPQPQIQLQQHPVLQQQPVAQPQPPVLPPQQPVAVPPQLPAPQPNQPALLQPPQGVQLPLPRIVIMPAMPRHTPYIQKRCLPPIPEDNKPIEPRRQKLKDQDVPVVKVSSGGSPPQVEVQLGWRGWPDLVGPADDKLRDAFEWPTYTLPREKTTIRVTPLSRRSCVTNVSNTANISKICSLTCRGHCWTSISVYKEYGKTPRQYLLEAEALEKKYKKEIKR